MKVRLDQLLVSRGLAGNEAEARAMIMAGQVRTADRVLDKPGMPADESLELNLARKALYVSRAGEKLASVAGDLGLDFNGKVVLDVGSSTGGFTDYALRAGAARSYCVDVGTGQLDWRLRRDPRVVVMEQTDIRHAKLPEEPDIAVIDVSFISLRQVLEPAAALLKPEAQIVAMAKPQFEARKAVADRFGGVIRDETVRKAILEDLKAWLAERFEVLKEANSKVFGTRGNREHFLLLRRK